MFIYGDKDDGPIKVAQPDWSLRSKQQINKQRGQKKNNKTAIVVVKLCYSEQVGFCLSWWVTHSSTAAAATRDSG